MGGAQGGRVWATKARRHVAHDTRHLVGPAALSVCGHSPLFLQPASCAHSRQNRWDRSGLVWSLRRPAALATTRTTAFYPPVFHLRVYPPPHCLNQASHEQRVVRHWRVRCPGRRGCQLSGGNPSMSLLQLKAGTALTKQKTTGLPLRYRVASAMNCRYSSVLLFDCSRCPRAGCCTDSIGNLPQSYDSST